MNLHTQTTLGSSRSLPFVEKAVSIASLEHETASACSSTPLLDGAMTNPHCGLATLLSPLVQQPHLAVSAARGLRTTPRVTYISDTENLVARTL